MNKKWSRKQKSLNWFEMCRKNVNSKRKNSNDKVFKEISVYLQKKLFTSISKARGCLLNEITLTILFIFHHLFYCIEINRERRSVSNRIWQLRGGVCEFSEAPSSTLKPLLWNNNSISVVTIFVCTILPKRYKRIEFTTLKKRWFIGSPSLQRAQQNEVWNTYTKREGGGGIQNE